MITFNFNEYTSTPYARNAEHDEERNGEDFEKKYLSQWIKDKQETLIKVDNLELPFSDSFVDASFCKLIRQDRESFDKYIKIDDKTEDEKDLLTTIKEVLARD
ncbi:hypothetical protein [Helicobacter fennelliae]|uniref:Uncharacterized protein n=1 Tax=Helicobacter fennelliae MRY12-0050 TaxID=1325130 RepID=T1CVT4_9HELI|nr:hypothetical protein [Helicobacter fennelliae]GAD17810.1 hypothetical protein HFN_0625 [Helicobacter fennelliae MRY12-0050]STP07701.1 Uncharacterised protein [Helicobacter fennelliae]